MSIYFRKKKISPIIAVVSKEMELNIAYVKQMDLLDDISGIKKISGKDYSDAEMQRLEKILINLTEGSDG